MATKDRIMQTAMKLFVKQSFENTPTSQIAKLAGISPGTLFYYFKTKEEIINETYLYVKRKMAELTYGKVDESDSVRDSLEKLWFNLIGWAQKNKLAYEYMHKYANSIYITDEVKEIVAGERSIFDTIIDIGFREDLFKKVPNKYIWYVFVYIGNGTVRFMNENKETDKKIISDGFEMFWDAVKK